MVMERERVKFLRVYLGVTVGYLIYKFSIYTLDTLFDMIDEIVDADTNTKEPLKIVGGQNDLLLRDGNGILEQPRNILKVILKPFAIKLGQLIKNIPIIKKLYNKVKTIKTIIGMILSMIGVRLIARYDYWAIIISEGLPILSVDDKAAIISIRRLRMGMKNVFVCLPQSEKALYFLTDEEIKNPKPLIDLFLVYEGLPETHLFKNAYFVCVVNLLLLLFFSNKVNFKLALKVLRRLLKDKKISKETYQQLVAQLIMGGVLPKEIEEENLIESQ